MCPTPRGQEEKHEEQEVKMLHPVEPRPSPLPTGGGCRRPSSGPAANPSLRCDEGGTKRTETLPSSPPFPPLSPLFPPTASLTICPSHGGLRRGNASAALERGVFLALCYECSQCSWMDSAQPGVHLNQNLERVLFFFFSGKLQSVALVTALRLTAAGSNCFH